LGGGAARTGVTINEKPTTARHRRQRDGGSFFMCFSL